MPERADRFPQVDALRALAAIAVLGTHAAIFAGADYPGSEVGRYAQRLEVGLTIFFVISGFLLYRPFVRGRVREPRAAADRPPTPGGGCCGSRPPTGSR